MWPKISSISKKKRTKEKDRTYKRVCNNLQWEHSQSKDFKPKN
jgi:hypothetical protein